MFLGFSSVLVLTESICVVFVILFTLEAKSDFVAMVISMIEFVVVAVCMDVPVFVTVVVIAHQPCDVSCCCVPQTL